MVGQQLSATVKTEDQARARVLGLCYRRAVIIRTVNLTRLLFGALPVAAAALIISSLPDLQRYLEISDCR